MKRTDEVQLGFKREADPKGLLNPGKMIAWDNPDFDLEDEQGLSLPRPAGGRMSGSALPALPSAVFR